MANFFMGGTEEYAGAIYGDYHQGTIDFLRNAPKIQTEVLSNTAKQFMAASERILGKFDLDDTLRKMRAAGRQVASIFQSNVIHELKTIGELQNPPEVMRHLIMACPEVRTAYFNQTIDGYSGKYNNIHGNAIGHDHHDYQRVMDGIVESTNDGFKVNNYLDIEDSDRLYFDQQQEVLVTWANVKAALRAGGDDPTSRWNAAL